MKRINCREAAIEGVITRHGTLVGPLMTELTGYPGADPVRRRLVRQRRVRGGALGGAPPAGAGVHASRWASGCGEEGYRGYFELDFLADMDTGEMWLGELNPRVTGASSMTNVTAVAYGDMPLFLFHLLEFLDVDYEIDVDELNAGWAQPSAIDEWSQFILKDTADVVELITEAPRSGIWKLDPAAHGGISFVRSETDWHTVASEDEAFYLRIAQTGGYRYPGADIGILVTRGRLQTDDHELTDRARTWISGIKRQFLTAPLDDTCAAARPGAGALLVQDAVSAMLTFEAIEELEPGPRWAALFERHWPRYRAWFLHEGEAARTSYAASLRALQEHMPELVPTYERVCELAGGGDLEARFLGMWAPPSYLAGCSQAVWQVGDPVLARNYDYAPERLEGSILHTALGAARDRLRRLRLGAARRPQRRRARRLARVRRTQGRRQRLRRSARRALPPRDVRDDGAGAGDAAAAAVPPRAHAHDRRRAAATSARRTSRPTATSCSRRPSSRRTTRGGSSGTSTRGRRRASSGSRRSSASSTRARRRSASSTASCSRRSSRRRQPAAGHALHGRLPRAARAGRSSAGPGLAGSSGSVPSREGVRVVELAESSAA